MVNLITDHMDIWTSAQTQKTNSARRGSHSANHSLHGIKKLRELILELAVRGKLVSQDPNDEPASVLLEKITREKARLIKEGKLKKQETLPKITDDEKAFELPRGWEWVRLGEVAEFVNGYAFKSSDFSDTGVGIVKIGDIQNGEITIASMSRVEEDIVAVLDDSLKVNNGDMLIAMSGATTGKLGFNRTNEIFYINQRVGKIIPHCLYVEYLYHPLTTKINENLAKSMGSAIPNLSTAQIKDIVLALPPLLEQHRIVAKVDELMVLCDQLDKQQTDSNVAHQTLVETLLATLTIAANQNEFVEAWQRIANHFHNLFTTEQSVDQLKQTILQLAVMGKLIPQDPKDEHASILLTKITAAKALLIKEGKIKKENPLPEISEEEKPYKLPDGWLWTRLGTISLINPRNEAEENLPASFVPMSLITTLHTGEHDQEDSIWGNIKQGYTHFANGDIGLAKITPCFENSKAVVFSNLKNGIGAGTTELHIARPLGNTLYARYVILYLKTPYYLHLGEIQMTGTAGQKRVPKNFFEENPFPLPPIAEQYRIVNKVDELMAVCDKLKGHINDAQKTQIQLADAIVEQAIA